MARFKVDNGRNVRAISCAHLAHSHSEVIPKGLQRVILKKVDGEIEGSAISEGD
jgi:hypothetical protein